MRQILLNAAEVVATAASVRSAGQNVKQGKVVSVACAVTVQAPAAGVFTATAATDVLNKVAHGFLTGLKVQVSTTTTLPAPLAAVTDYFVIKIDADNFYLATTLVNAQAGTRIDITTAGTGVQTVTPTALAGASVKLQGTTDDVISASSVWFDLPIYASGDISKSGSISASVNILLSEVDPTVNQIAAYYTLTAGQLSVAQQTLVKGDS